MSNMSRKRSATKAALNVANRAVAFDQAVMCAPAYHPTYLQQCFSWRNLDSQFWCDYYLEALVYVCAWIALPRYNIVILISSAKYI